MASVCTTQRVCLSAACRGIHHISIMHDGSCTCFAMSVDPHTYSCRCTKAEDDEAPCVSVDRVRNIIHTYMAASELLRLCFGRRTISSSVLQAAAMHRHMQFNCLLSTGTTCSCQASIRDRFASINPSTLSLRKRFTMYTTPGQPLWLHELGGPCQQWLQQ